MASESSKSDWIPRLVSGVDRLAVAHGGGSKAAAWLTVADVEGGRLSIIALLQNGGAFEGSVSVLVDLLAPVDRPHAALNEWMDHFSQLLRSTAASEDSTLTDAVRQRHVIVGFVSSMRILIQRTRNLKDTQSTTISGSIVRSLIDSIIPTYMTAAFNALHSPLLEVVTDAATLVEDRKEKQDIVDHLWSTVWRLLSSTSRPDSRFSKDPLHRLSFSSVSQLFFFLLQRGLIPSDKESFAHLMQKITIMTVDNVLFNGSRPSEQIAAIDACRRLVQSPAAAASKQNEIQAVNEETKEICRACLYHYLQYHLRYHIMALHLQSTSGSFSTTEAVMVNDAFLKALFPSSTLSSILLLLSLFFSSIISAGLSSTISISSFTIDDRLKAFYEDSIVNDEKSRDDNKNNASNGNSRWWLSLWQSSVLLCFAAFQSKDRFMRKQAAELIRQRTSWKQSISASSSVAHDLKALNEEYNCDQWTIWLQLFETLDEHSFHLMTSLYPRFPSLFDCTLLRSIPWTALLLHRILSQHVPTIRSHAINTLIQWSKDPIIKIKLHKHFAFSITTIFHAFSPFSSSSLVPKSESYPSASDQHSIWLASPLILRPLLQYLNDISSFQYSNVFSITVDLSFPYLATPPSKLLSIPSSSLSASSKSLLLSATAAEIVQDVEESQVKLLSGERIILFLLEFIRNLSTLAERRAVLVAVMKGTSQYITNYVSVAHVLCAICTLLPLPTESAAGGEEKPILEWQWLDDDGILMEFVSVLLSRAPLAAHRLLIQQIIHCVLHISFSFFNPSKLSFAALNHLFYTFSTLTAPISWPLPSSPLFTRIHTALASPFNASPSTQPTSVSSSSSSPFQTTWLQTHLPVAFREFLLDNRSLYKKDGNRMNIDANTLGFLFLHVNEGSELESQLFSILGDYLQSLQYSKENYLQSIRLISLLNSILSNMERSCDTETNYFATSKFSLEESKSIDVLSNFKSKSNGNPDRINLYNHRFSRFLSILEPKNNAIIDFICSLSDDTTISLHEFFSATPVVTQFLAAWFRTMLVDHQSNESMPTAAALQQSMVILLENFAKLLTEGNDRSGSSPEEYSSQIRNRSFAIGFVYSGVRFCTLPVSTTLKSFPLLECIRKLSFVPRPSTSIQSALEFPASKWQEIVDIFEFHRWQVANQLLHHFRVQFLLTNQVAEQWFQVCLETIDSVSHQTLRPLFACIRHLLDFFHSFSATSISSSSATFSASTSATGDNNSSNKNELTSLAVRFNPLMGRAWLAIQDMKPFDSALYCDYLLLLFHPAFIGCTDLHHDDQAGAPFIIASSSSNVKVSSSSKSSKPSKSSSSQNPATISTLSPYRQAIRTVLSYGQQHHHALYLFSILFSHMLSSHPNLSDRYLQEFLVFYTFRHASNLCADMVADKLQIHRAAHLTHCKNVPYYSFRLPEAIRSLRLAKAETLIRMILYDQVEQNILKVQKYYNRIVSYTVTGSNSTAATASYQSVLSETEFNEFLHHRQFLYQLFLLTLARPELVIRKNDGLKEGSVEFLVRCYIWQLLDLLAHALPIIDSESNIPIENYLSNISSKGGRLSEFKSLESLWKLPSTDSALQLCWENYVAVESIAVRHLMEVFFSIVYARLPHRVVNDAAVRLTQNLMRPTVSASIIMVLGCTGLSLLSNAPDCFQFSTTNFLPPSHSLSSADKNNILDHCLACIYPFLSSNAGPVRMLAQYFFHSIVLYHVIHPLSQHRAALEPSSSSSSSLSIREDKKDAGSLLAQSIHLWNTKAKELAPELPILLDPAGNHDNRITNTLSSNYSCCLLNTFFFLHVESEVVHVRARQSIYFQLFAPMRRSGLQAALRVGVDDDPFLPLPWWEKFRSEIGTFMTKLRSLYDGNEGEEDNIDNDNNNDNDYKDSSKDSAGEVERKGESDAGTGGVALNFQRKVDISPLNAFFEHIMEVEDMADIKQELDILKTEQAKLIQIEAAKQINNKSKQDGSEKKKETVSVELWSDGDLFDLTYVSDDQLLGDTHSSSSSSATTAVTTASSKSSSSSTLTALVSNASSPNSSSMQGSSSSLIRSVVSAKLRAALHPIIVVASFVGKAVNLAGLARTCEIMSVDRLLVGDANVVNDAQFQTIAVTADKWLQIDELKPKDVSAYLRAMRAQGYGVVALEQTAHSVVLTEYQFPSPCIVVLGNETEGVPVEIVQQVDACVEIPQYGTLRSFNVHVSGALILWECVKQYNAKR